jgi:hypothetical protein
MGNKQTTQHKAERYSGEAKHNRAHGKGQLSYSAKDKARRAIYRGYFVDGRKQGQGTMTWTDGRTYSGYWWADLMHGKGTMIWPTTRSYEGEWIAGQRHGMGHMKFADDDRHGRVYYFGPWVAGKKQGQGFMEWRSGAKYLGEWHQGKRHGHGVFMFPNGDQYVGQWCDGRPQGIGRLLYSDGGFGCDGFWMNAGSWEHTRTMAFRALTA